MQPKTPAYLEHIRDAARFVADYTCGVSLEEYEANRPMRQAVERSFEVMGEAMRRLEHHDPEVASTIPEARDVVGFRNVLIHAYDSVDHAQVWLTIRDRLPPLLERIEQMLADIDAARP